MAGPCSAHKEYVAGCPQCEAVKPEEIKITAPFLCSDAVGLERLRQAGAPIDTGTGELIYGSIEIQRSGLVGVVFIWRDDGN